MWHLVFLSRRIPRRYFVSFSTLPGFDTIHTVSEDNELPRHNEEQAPVERRPLVVAEGFSAGRAFADQELSMEELETALRVLDQGVGQVDHKTYAALVQLCSKAKALEEGKRVHGHLHSSGYHADCFLANLLTQMYGNCGSVLDARNVFDGLRRKNLFSWTIMVAAYAQNGHLLEARALFDEMPERNAVSWNLMIATYTRNAHGKQALRLFALMDLDGVQPTKITFTSVLDACASPAFLAEGKAIHASIIESGHESDVSVGTAVVDMYGKCGSIENARRVYEKLHRQDVILWTAMLTAYAQNGDLHRAKQIFDEMPHRTVVSWNAMIGAYSHKGHLLEAVEMFNTMLVKDVVSWTAMIAAYAQNGHYKESLKLFRVMYQEGLQPNQTTVISVLNACANLGALADGRIVHEKAVDRGFHTKVEVKTALLNMYGKCGSSEVARGMFDETSEQDVVSWTAMIAAYVKNGHGNEALALFRRMDHEGSQPNTITFVGVLDACASLSKLAEGRIVHAEIVQQGLHLELQIASALVSMYGKCGKLEDAKMVFDGLPLRDLVVWSVLISAYAENGHWKEAFDLLPWMGLEGMLPNDITFVSILSACSHAGSVRTGWQYFVAMIGDYGIVPLAEHYMCMIDLLGRAGQLKQAEDLINDMPFQPSAGTWMTLLGACKVHGDTKRGRVAADMVLELDPGDPAIYVMLSNMYATAGEHRKFMTKFVNQVR